ncbi:hypothetical protein ACOMHN_007696 [Nucella lapillus]
MDVNMPGFFWRAGPSLAPCVPPSTCPLMDPSCWPRQCGSAVTDVTGRFPSANRHYLCIRDVKFPNKTGRGNRGGPQSSLRWYVVCASSGRCVWCGRAFSVDVPARVPFAWINCPSGDWSGGDHWPGKCRAISGLESPITL